MNMPKFHLSLLGSALVTLALFSASAWSYDADLAARYAQMFAPAKEKATSKELHCMKPEGFVNMIKKGEPMMGIDIRTPAETSVFALALPGSLSIPINELFLMENLARIPQDRPVVLLCQTGMRAGMAVVALRQLGFEKVFAVAGGFKGLSDYLDPMTANSPVSEPPAGK